jgi:hypothetical protein
MKRLILCAVAVLLTSGALISSRPAYACTMFPDCDPFDCYNNCVATGHHNGVCSTCTGRCTCS